MEVSVIDNLPKSFLLVHLSQFMQHSIWNYPQIEKMWQLLSFKKIQIYFFPAKVIPSLFLDKVLIDSKREAAE